MCAVLDSDVTSVGLLVESVALRCEPAAVGRSQYQCDKKIVVFNAVKMWTVVI